MNAPTPVKKLLGKLTSRQAEPPSVPDLALFERSAPAITMSMSTYRWVLALTALVAVYFLFIAEDRYAVHTQVFVKSAQPAAPTLTVSTGLIGGGPGLQDALVLRDYIASLDMLRILERDMELRAHYTSLGDFYSALSADASEQQFLDYYHSRVSTRIDDASQTITISVQAYTAEFARDVSARILKEAEDFINATGQEVARSDVAFAERELESIRARLTAAQEELVDFQNANNLLDPEATGAAQQSMISGLQARIVELETEESALSTFLNPSASELVSVRERLRALREQLDKEQAKLTSAEQRALNEVGIEFQQRKLAVEYAGALYRTGIESLEQARVEAYRKLKHLVVIQTPVLPEEAEYPRRLYNILTAFVLLSLAYAIIVMIWATVQEHRDV